MPFLDVTVTYPQDAVSLPLLGCVGQHSKPCVYANRAS